MSTPNAVSDAPLSHSASFEKSALAKQEEARLANHDIERTGESSKGASEREKGGHRVVDAVVAEDVFAVGNEGGPDFRGVSFAGALALMLKSQIGLGVLSLPSVMNTLGIVPGMLALVILGALATYGDYILGQFRYEFPGVHSIGDIGYIMFGPIGREFLGWSYWLFQIFIAAAGMLSFSIALNAVTVHATCTIVFVIVAAVLIGLGASLRTFKAISWLGWIGVCTIIPAILTCTIAVALADRPGNAPATGPFDKELKAFGSPTFAKAMVAVVNTLFAYGGSPGYVSVMAEMKNPNDYTKAMLWAQGISVGLYILVSVILWNYAGVYVASPALGTAGPLIKKIGYGLAMPGLIAGPVIAIHLAAIYAFVKFLRGSRHLQSNTAVHWFTWIGLIFSMTALAFIIAEVIPFFDELIGLIGAVFCSLFVLGLEGMMWIYQNDYKRHHGRTSISYKFLYFICSLMLLIGAFVLVAGFYGTVVGIKDAFAEGTVGSPFSCADNSNST